VSVRAGMPVSVTCWGELRGDRALPGCLRVLVDGQSAGGAERKGDSWAAYWYAGMSPSGALRDRVSEHATAEEAVRAVVRSPWARRLGARASSRFRGRRKRSGWQDVGHKPGRVFPVDDTVLSGLSMLVIAQRWRWTDSKP
jgi:hypothetical protein